MAKYLNLSGLQTLWTKIKDTFATKTDLDNKVSKSGYETIEGEKEFSFWRTLFTSSGRSTKRIIVGNDFRKVFIGISAAKDDGSGGNILLSELGGTENLSGGDKSIIYTSNRSTNYQFNGNAKTATSATSATTATNADKVDGYHIFVNETPTARTDAIFFI